MIVMAKLLIHLLSNQLQIGEAVKTRGYLNPPVHASKSSSSEGRFSHAKEIQSNTLFWFILRMRTFRLGEMYLGRRQRRRHSEVSIRRGKVKYAAECLMSSPPLLIVWVFCFGTGYCSREW